MNGDAGDDAIYGGDGSDRAYGGAGDDTVAGDDGDDVIVSFVQGDDRIDLDLDAFTFTSVSFGQNGADAVIFYGETTITVRDFVADDFTTSDFI